MLTEIHVMPSHSRDWNDVGFADSDFLISLGEVLSRFLQTKYSMGIFPEVMACGATKSR